MSARQPDLLLISGLPGTGRASLSAAVGERLSTPVFSRDAYREVCTVRSDGALSDPQYDELSWELLFLTLRAMATARSGGIFTADFTPALHKGPLEALRRETGMRMIEFHCTAGTGAEEARRDAAVWPTAIAVDRSSLTPRQAEDYVVRRLEELRPQ